MAVPLVDVSFQDRRRCTVPRVLRIPSPVILPRLSGKPIEGGLGRQTQSSWRYQAYKGVHCPILEPYTSSATMMFALARKVLTRYRLSI
jgi:hypothetical protein